MIDATSCTDLIRQVAHQVGETHCRRKPVHCFDVVPLLRTE